MRADIVQNDCSVLWSVVRPYVRLLRQSQEIVKGVSFVLHFLYVVGWSLDPTTWSTERNISLFYSVLPEKYGMLLHIRSQTLPSISLIFDAAWSELYWMHTLKVAQPLALAERDIWNYLAFIDHASTNIKHRDGEQFKGLVFRLMWFVYDPRYADEGLNLKLYMKNSYVIFFLLFLRFSAW